MPNQGPTQSMAAGARLPPGTETGQTPPNKTTQQQTPLPHTQLQPAQPYTRIQLTVEPDSFVLQPYHDPPAATADVSAAPKHNATTDLVQILFRVPDIDAERDTDEQKHTELDVEGQINEEKANTKPDGSSSFSGLVEGQNGRVSFLAPGSYTRSENAKDYIIYGCIGLLDLYTGPHFIVITSVKPLGDIEDKPVYAIKKVAVLPMDERESRQVLDRLAQWIDLSAGPVDHIREPSDQQSSIQESLADEEEKEEQLAAPTTPKIKFSFLGLRQDKGLQKSSSSTSLPVVSKSIDLDRNDVNVTGASLPSSKGLSFNIPQLGFGSRSNTNLSISTNPTNESNGASGSTVSSPPSSPLLSPKSRSPQPGLFAKLKESVLDKKPRKSLDGDTPGSITEDKESSINSVEPVDGQTRADDGLTTVPRAPALVLDLTNVGKNGIQSPSGPKSPSAYEAAEKFMIDSTKQLANWSEGAVTGVLKSTTSFALSKSTSEAGEQEQDEYTKSASNMSEDVQTKEDELEKSRMLDRRVIREISSIFGNGFYFSTEFNLLSSKQKRFDFARDKMQGSVPLWKQVDKRFWWNEHLLKEFLEIEADGYILPVMQGYVEMEQCVIEEQPFEFTLISRRSRERSGLRYQRRGIDDDGNTANFVETEQLLRIVRDDSDHQVSFVQTRGSIPLFWSQSPYRLKPIPIMERSEKENEEGFKKHFDGLIKQYGRQICINLVEQHGRELIAGSAYTRYIEKLAEPQVRYVEFDFHEHCKGMKYENIERLIKSLETPILELGYCWLAPRNDRAAQKRDESFERLYDQKGVIRTNCMDCLDRTNVVQSAIGRYILNHQLLRLGIASFPDKGLSVYEDFENVFNNVWANNGDAISREYAGTSALKGDFTRTGKRNLQGMINDATNSMARMYQNTFKDYFRQAAIDYLLGAADVNVFKNLQTTPFGTVVVPPPILPPSPEVSQLAASKGSAPSPSLDGVVAEASHSDVLPPSLLRDPSLVSDSQPSAPTETESGPLDEKAMQQDTWAKIREAAIETSAEIVISPGEERWKGWTFICCSNEISSSLTSASSPQSSPRQPASASKSADKSLPTNIKKSTSSSKSDNSLVFYDEKVVLLTDRALYICTYDYDMEKVLEFWRLALEKITGIDKGVFFLTAQNKSPQGQNPLENYGFEVLYRASAGGETLRVNSGSVRNRRMMGISRTSPEEFSNLSRVPEEEADDHDTEESFSVALDVRDDSDAHDDGRSAKGLLRDEPNEIRSARFKIVKHPETSVVPYVTSSTTESGQNKANPLGYRRTAQDCVEWVVTEIVQARCELISVVERGRKNDTDAAVYNNGKQTTALDGLQIPQGQWRHDRSPSEEYDYSPLQRHRSSVHLDLEIRDRVLQSLEVAEQLEKESLLKESGDKNKKSKKPFSSFFTLGKTSKEQGSQPTPTASSSGSNSRSWLKKLQFGQDSDSDDTDSEDDDRQVRATETTAVTQDQHLATEIKSPNSNIRSGNQGVFAKFKQAVKSF